MNTPDTPTVHPDQTSLVERFDRDAGEIVSPGPVSDVSKGPAPRKRAPKGKAPSGKTTISVELPTALANSLDAEAERRLIGRGLLVRKILEAGLERLADQQVEITLQ